MVVSEVVVLVVVGVVLVIVEVVSVAIVLKKGVPVVVGSEK